MEKLKIQPVSEGARAIIERKTAYALPDNPTAAGMKPSDIKKAFYAPIVDAENSILKEVDRVVKEANDALGKLEGEIKLVFADSIEECTDTSKIYVLPDGYIYEYVVSALSPTFENKADPSSDEWLNGYRLNSYAEAIEFEGLVVTNFIEVPSDGVMRVKGIDLETIVNEYKPKQACFHYSVNSAPNSVSSFYEGVEHYKYKKDGTYIFENELDKPIWFRFCGAPIDGNENVIITVNEEIEYITSPKFESTGRTFGGIDYEERVEELEAKTQNHEERVSILESELIEIPSFWKDAITACVAKIKALQTGRNCVTFPFFSDNHTRAGKPQHMGKLIAYIMKECGIPYCFYGGDAITNAYSSTDKVHEQFMAEAEAFDKAMSYIPEGKFCMALGNHESYLLGNPDIEGSTTVEYNRNQTYEIFLRKKGMAQNKHFGEDGTYYYVDDIASKTRWIVLNTNGVGGRQDTNIDDKQLSWFKNVALSFNGGGWGVVIISHVPITNHYEQSNIGNNNAVISTLQNYINSSNANKADIIGWFSGHIHRDRIYTGVSVNDDDDSVGEYMGFRQVTITSDHTAIAYPVGGSPTTHPIDDSDKSHAIDFVTINKDTKTVNITRLGIGEDRSYTY